MYSMRTLIRMQHDPADRLTPPVQHGQGTQHDIVRDPGGRRPAHIVECEKIRLFRSNLQRLAELLEPVIEALEYYRNKCRVYSGRIMAENRADTFFL